MEKLLLTASPSAYMKQRIVVVHGVSTSGCGLLLFFFFKVSPHHASLCHLLLSFCLKKSTCFMADHIFYYI